MVAVISQPPPSALATGAGAPPSGGGDDRRGKKPSRAHQKEDVVLSDSTSEDTRARLEEAEALADRVAIMHAGRVVEEGSPDEFFDHPKTQRARDFLDSIKGH